VEGVVRNRDPYSDSAFFSAAAIQRNRYAFLYGDPLVAALEKRRASLF
jgi:hypothetical protein